MVLTNERLTERLKQIPLDFVQVLGDTLKAQDQYTVRLQYPSRALCVAHGRTVGVNRRSGH